MVGGASLVLDAVTEEKAQVHRWFGALKMKEALPGFIVTPKNDAALLVGLCEGLGAQAQLIEVLMCPVELGPSPLKRNRARPQGHEGSAY